MTISIIIPTLNEAQSLEETIRALRSHHPHEIIVADGGSIDGTLEVARHADRRLTAPRGRAAQMNAGAAVATGKVLLFLHADCRLTEGALIEAERILRRPRVVAGCFRMCVQHPGRLYRWIDFMASLRVRLSGIVYGDQGLFLRKAVFEQTRGFPPLRFMEDVYFSRTLRTRGSIVQASHRILVSPRRWQKTGILGQTIRNWTLVTLAACGVHPNRLAAYYPSLR